MGFSQPVHTSTPARRGDIISTGSPLQEHMPADLPLTFAGPLVVVGGGQVEPHLLHELSRFAAGFVGADRGGDVLMAAGIVPDAVIGDMDSVADRAAFAEKTRVIALAEQDSTDFEKCLYCTSAPVTIALGMTGGRFDHTLAALHAVARQASKRTIILLDERDLALGVSGSVSLEVGAGQRVSIYPLGRTAFSGSSGLLYPLDGLVMRQGERIGTSNRSVTDRIEIAVAPGEQDPWLMIVERSLLPLFVNADQDGSG